jgi:hypothetical protein
MYLSPRSIGLLATGFLVFLLLELMSGMYFMSCMGLALFAGLAVKFVQDLGKRLEIRDIISFMAVMQWIVGPVMAYNYLPADPLYFMSVSEARYMNFVVPVCYAMVLGLYFPLAEERIVDRDDLDRAAVYLKARPWLGYILAAVGLAAGFVSKYLPQSLTFLMFLITNLQYVGVYMVLFSGSKFRWLIFAGIMGLATSAAVLQGMFGELVQWFMLSFLVIAMAVRIPMWGKVLMISAGIFLIQLVQATKQEYRMATWYANSDKSNSEIYQEIIAQRISSPAGLFNAETSSNMAARLNQGWIIARIMNHMPEKLDYVHGETIETAVYAALLPRFLAPSKARAGGRANFERFTGTPLPETTSMDISLVGEGYANFGYLGGIAFIFLVSLFYNWVVIKIVSFSRKNPSLVLWIPFLFFQVMKAETDFATVFNYITKAALITFLTVFTIDQIEKMVRNRKKIIEPVSEDLQR